VHRRLLRTLVPALLVLAAPSFAGSLPPADFGDAPEGIACYPDGTLGHFPSCLASAPAGTQVAPCAAPGSAPGPTGFVRHVQTAGLNFWIGCGTPGMDVEADAKVGPAAGATCGLVTADCTALHGAWTAPMSFLQDECAGDGVDAMGGFGGPDLFAANEGLLSTVSFPVQNAGPAATAYLNVLIDMNGDGDWNDVIADFSPCHPEWVVKNHVVSLPAGCSTVASPSFQVTQSNYPSYFVPSWVRITISGVPVSDDFAWNGSASTPDGALAGGETEDYPAVILFADPVTPTSWGRVKTIYR
jgi:GEVED domain